MPTIARWSVAACVALLFLVWVTPAVAQPVPPFLVASSADDPSQGMPTMNRVSASVGPDMRTGASLTADTTDHYGRPAHGGDHLAAARARLHAAEDAYTAAYTQRDQAAINRTMSDLETLASEFDSSPDGFDATPENLSAVQDLFVFIATAFDRTADPTRSAEYVRRLARIDPALPLSPVTVPENIRRMYQETADRLPRGSLAVDSSLPGCAVFRDGQRVGTAPIELQDLPQGRHRIQLRCGATYSFVHPVDVTARTRATLSIDPQLDAALSFEGPTPALLYPTISGAQPRIARDLASLGRALGAHRVYGVIASEDRVVVVDVATGTVVGESPVTDGSRLRALRTQALGAANAQGGEVASTAPRSAESPAPPTTAVEVRRPYVPVGGIVLGGVAALLLGTGIYSDVARVSSINRAQQASDAHLRWVSEGDARNWQYVEIATFVVGGVVAVSAVLVGVLAAPQGSARRASVTVAPLASGGAWAGVGEVF